MSIRSLVARVARRASGRSWAVPAEQQALRSLVRPGDCVFDVGANYGELAVFTFAPAVGPAGLVAAFEPVPPTYARLCRTLQGPRPRGSAPVVPLPFAATDADCTLPLWVPPHSDEESSFAETPGGVRFECPARRLDAACEAFRLPPPALVKIDVEGAEPLALRGAAGLVAAARPLIFCELFAPWLRRLGLAPWDTLGPLAAAGYSFLFHAPAGFVAHSPSAAEPFPPGFEGGYNVLAHLPHHADRVRGLSAIGGPEVPPPEPNR
jgi:FkbM family methyltransferase